MVEMEVRRIRSSCITLDHCRKLQLHPGRGGAVIHPKAFICELVSELWIFWISLWTPPPPNCEAQLNSEPDWKLKLSDMVKKGEWNYLNSTCGSEAQPTYWYRSHENHSSVWQPSQKQVQKWQNNRQNKESTSSKGSSSQCQLLLDQSISQCQYWKLWLWYPWGTLSLSWMQAPHLKRPAVPPLWRILEECLPKPLWAHCWTWLQMPFRNCSYRHWK